MKREVGSRGFGLIIEEELRKEADGEVWELPCRAENFPWTGPLRGTPLPPARRRSIADKTTLSDGTEGPTEVNASIFSPPVCFLDSSLPVIIVVPLIVTGCLSYLVAQDPWALGRSASRGLPNPNRWPESSAPFQKLTLCWSFGSDRPSHSCTLTLLGGFGCEKHLSVSI